MSLLGLFNFLRRSLQRAEATLTDIAGFDRNFAPALAVHGPCVLPQSVQDGNPAPSFLDSIFWMAAPKKRRTIEINRTRRRAPEKLIKVKTNIEPCLECGHPKQKHTLCGYCYAKVRRETGEIRKQIFAMEGKPLNTPAMETVILYDGETPGEGDKDKRVVERPRKRPSWFILS
ncbi:39S ribosomal protein L32, mitochondrial [Alosa sapidissima]|uniref:39S ribosomal protein L32, mitochondrial n=1 Tax=Alosa sapidissima TaxID=34773 RepID=UPI001C088E4F|nr:39S ribosomal protein L32, mitochondrial [Alosa sapidissima]